MKHTKGFTLIELMIVVAILSLLSAIAIPQYQGYVIKTQITRGFAEINSLRTAIEVCESDGGVSGTCDISHLDNIDSDMLITNPTLTLNPSSISAEFGQNAVANLHGATIDLSKDENGAWQCEITAPNVNQAMIPNRCR